MLRLANLLVTLAAATVVSACKLAIINVEGGEVQSDSSGVCGAGAICEVEVPDTGFSENFTAVADPGWYFKKWNSGDGFLCGGAANSKCTLDLQEYEGNDGVERLVASSGVAYLMPVFRQIQPDTIRVEGRAVIVDGRRWLQPIDFLDYNCSEISMLCPPDQVCSGTLANSTLDLTGYRWASRDDVYALFNVYDGAERAILEDFEQTLTDKESHTGGVVANILYAMLSDVVFRGCEPAVIATVYDGSPEETGPEERNIGLFPDPEPRGGKDFRAGAWLWKPVD